MVRFFGNTPFAIRRAKDEAGCADERVQKSQSRPGRFSSHIPSPYTETMGNRRTHQRRLRLSVQPSVALFLESNRPNAVQEISRA
jgi:hypothetical protein